MQASTIASTAITIVQVIPFAMKPACSRIHAVSKSAAAKSPTSSARITAHTTASFSLNGTRADRSSKVSRRLRLSRAGGSGGCATCSSPPPSRLAVTSQLPAQLTPSPCAERR